MLITSRVGHIPIKDIYPELGSPPDQTKYRQSGGAHLTRHLKSEKGRHDLRLRSGKYLTIGKELGQEEDAGGQEGEEGG